MADRDELVANFVRITNAPAERAQFLLEAAGWNLDLAMSSFFEEPDEEDMSGAEPGAAATPSQPAAAPSFTAPGRNEPGRGPSRGGIATLSSLQSSGGTGGHNGEDDDSEKGQEFFAGGSEHSGQMISGPPKKKRNDPRGLAESVMSAAKEQGAETEDERVARQKAVSSTFTGSGYRLGETPEESRIVVHKKAQKVNEDIQVTIYFWQNGFSVDDGPLRNGQSEEDQKFLNDIKEGVIPQELLQLYGRKEIGVTLERKDSVYMAPKKKLKAFTGSGNRLGSPTPGVAESASSAATSASSASSSLAAGTAAATAPREMILDESKPKTSLQIRLADGSRLVGKFNTCHTIADVRAFINQSRPAQADKPFYLMTSFPSKELADETATLESAGLLNAVVMQRVR